jgi:signal transduction histidine kinase
MPSKARVLGAEGIPQFLHGSYQDIAERKRVETQLAAARDEAREESAVKTAFLEPMSHQLFTPLNAIIGVRRPHTAGDPRTHFQTQLSGVRENTAAPDSGLLRCSARW